MKRYYEILGLENGASQEEIEAVYKRLSKELDPANNENQEFFIEEYKKLQQAYKALSASSILATEKGAKQNVKKPNSSFKNKNDSAKPTKDKLNTPKKKNVRRDILLLFIATGIWGLLLQNIGFFDYIQKEYQRDYITKNMTVLQRRAQDLKELTILDQRDVLWRYGMTRSQLNILENAREEDLISHIMRSYQKAYKTLGLQENASQKEIQDAYDRLSKEKKPPKGLKFYYDILLRLTMPLEEWQNFIRGE